MNGAIETREILNNDTDTLKSEEDIVKTKEIILNLNEYQELKKKVSIKELVFLFIKRFFDIICGIIGVALLIPIALILKIITICTGDFHSIFFSQNRIGKNGKEFKLYKFRSMIVNADEESETEAEVQENVSLLKFASKYKKFIVFLLGFVLVYFAHTIINNFFIQIITNVGGNSSDMGNAVFLAAMLELPTMAYFTKLSQKVNCGTLIKASIVLFLAKHAITYLATNMVMIYIAQVLQMGAYALFIPASVYYVNCKVDNKDIVKGQSFVTTSMTMSGVFANIIGGILLDAVGVSEVLLIGVILSLIGAVIVLFTVEKV